MTYPLPSLSALLRRGRPLRAALFAAACALLLPSARAQSADYENDQVLTAATVTLATTKLTLGELFALCEKQTDFKFVFVKSDLPLNAEITFPTDQRVTLAAALSAASTQANVLFQRTNHQIAARPGRVASGRVVLEGYIHDLDTKRVLFGATVTLAETGRTAIADSDGRFALRDLAPGRYTLLIDCIGYQPITQAVTIADDREARADFVLRSDAISLGKFVVEGEREGQARALQEKHNADSIMDVVSSDSAGKLPDGNAAEAARRLPGVFAQIDQNEGRFIVVRGIDPNLSNITINGLSVGSPAAGDRGASMDAIPADLIDRIEVIKAVTPDMDAQAVGALINIVTPSAFDRSEPFAHGTASGGYFNGPSKKMPYSFSATAGTQFGDGKWGIVIGASDSYRHYVSNRRSGGSPWFPSAASGAGASILFPGTESLYYYDENRWRRGVTANLEYRPNSDSAYFFRVENNFFQDHEGRTLNSFEFYRSTYPASYTATTATFTGGRSSIEYRDYLQKHRINNYSAGGKNELANGRLHFDYMFSVGDTGIKVPARNEWQFRSAATIASSIDVSSAPYWKVTPEPKWFDLSTYPLRQILLRGDDEYEDIYNALANLKGDFKFLGHSGFWQVGGKYMWHQKGWVRTENELFPVGSWTLATYASSITLPTKQIFGGMFPMAGALAFPAVQNFFNAHPELTTPSPAVAIGDANSNYFKIKEETEAEYAMARLNFSQGSILAGVRVENTDVNVKGIQNVTQNGAAIGYQPYTADGNYLEVLPGLHLRYTPAKNVVLRAAWTNTFGRPPYSSIGVTRSFTYAQDPGANTYSGSVKDGNPDLKPYESANYDLGAEYYLPHEGIVSIGGFHKDIKNPIYTFSYTDRNTTYEGLNFSSLAYSKPLNAYSGRVTGVEFNYQQQLTMLPEFLSGFGFNANLTLVHSTEALPTRPTESLPFAKQANRLYNLALFYQKGPFEARVAYTFTSAYVLSFGANVYADSYQGKRGIIDAKASYRLNRHLTLFADVINLGQEPLIEYSGDPSLNSAVERYWWTANFGVNWKL